MIGSRPPITGGNSVVTRNGVFMDGEGAPPALRRALPLPEARFTSLLRNYREDRISVYVRWELLGQSTTLRHDVDDVDQLDDEYWWRAQQCEAARVIRSQHGTHAAFEQTR